MAQQTINVGTAPNDGTGTPLRTAFQYTNSNFSELYTAVGPSGNNIVVPGSATITGDLTVDTSTLKVDSTNNRVTVGTLSAYGRLTVGVGSGLQAGTTTNVAAGLVDIDYATTGDINTRLSFVNSNGATNAAIDRIGNPNFNDNGNLAFLTRAGAGSLTERYRIAADGVATWSNVGGVAGTAMTLNSTGLGVGTSPSQKLDIIGSLATRAATTGANQDVVSIRALNSDASAYANALYYANSQKWHYSGASLGMTLDSSGNLGIGVTPSAWNSSYRGLQLGAGGAISAHTSASLPWLVATSNSFINSAGDWKFINNGYSTRYLARGDDGTQSWWTSNNGLAGGTVAYTQAMTLTAAGELLVTKTTANATVVGVQAASTGEFSSTMASAISAQSTLNVYSTGAAAYRFYVGMNGTINATNTTISAISDARLKENVQDIDVGLGAILALKPRKFDWKAGKGKDIKGDRGFIAQEFEQVFPNLIDEWKDAAPEGETPYKSVRQDLIPVLVKAIQELAAEVNALKNA